MRAIFRAAALLVIVGAWGVLGVWIIGRVATDRLFVTQFLFWIPSWLLAGAGLVLALGSLGLAALGLSRRREAGEAGGADGSRSRRKGGWVRAVARLTVAAATVICLWTLHLEVRPLRVLTGGSEPPAGALRVVAWNMTATTDYAWGDWVEAIPDDPTPDILILSNPIHGNRRFQEVAESQGPGFHSVRSGPLSVTTHLPVLSWGGISLDLPNPSLRERRQAGGGADGSPEGVVNWLVGKIAHESTPYYDPGHAMFVVLDATDTLFGRPLTVWVMDLPSDIELPRYEAAGLVRERLAAVRQESPEAFPDPDVVAGDFNSPRGAASLERLLPEMTNAYVQSGSGFAASFPREDALVHLDQTYLNKGVKSADYAIVDPGVSNHRAQALWVFPDRAGGGRR